MLGTIPIGSALAAGAAFIVFVLLLTLARRTVRVAQANQILVISGFEHEVDGKRYGFRLVRGGWTVVIPWFERVEILDLTIVPINVRVEGVNSANGITVGADATACVCIDDVDNRLLYNAVERLLGKSTMEIQEQLQMTMVGNFRGALNRTTPLQAIGMTEASDDDPANDAEAEGGERNQFRKLLLDDCAEDLASFGMKVVSVSLQRIWDTSSYIANLANKTLSRKKKEVEIAEAQLKADALQAESDAQRRAQVARADADRRIAEAEGKLKVYQRECEAAIEQARLSADASIAEATNESERGVQEFARQLQELKNRSDVLVKSEAEREVARMLASADAESVQILQGARNDLLRRKIELLRSSGAAGKLALLATQLPDLYRAYQAHGGTMKVESLLVAGQQDAFCEAVNRGPRAMVDFLAQLERGFGLDVRKLLGAAELMEDSASPASKPGEKGGTR